ncbi:MAG: MFS transporter [Planctomycetota bacterium]
MSKRPLLVIFITVFVDLLGFGIVLPLLSVYADKLQATAEEVGLLSASFSAMQFLFAPVWGRISDRVGRRPIIILGLLGSVIFYAVFGYASAIGSLTLMFVARIGAGLSGATISTAQAYIADSTTPDKRTAGMAIIGAAFAIGMTFGPLIGGVALLYSHPSEGNLSAAPGYLASGISAIALLLAIFILPESLKEGERAKSSGWMNLTNLKLALANSITPALLLTAFVAVFSFAKFESTLSLLAEKGFGYTNREIYLTFTYIGVVLTLAQGFLVRRLAKKMPEKKMAILGVVGMVIGMFSLLYAISSQSTSHLLIALPILVIGFALVSSSVQGWLSRTARADQQGGILGINQALAALARILGFYLGVSLLLGTKMFGSLATEPNLSRPYWISLVLMGIAFLLILLLPSPPKTDGEVQLTH